MNKNNKIIEDLFSSVRNEITVPSYEIFLRGVTNKDKKRNILRGWKLIPSLRMVVGMAFVAVLILPVIYSHKASETDPLLATLSDEGTQEIENLAHEDEFINSALDHYLQQLETING